MTMSIAPSVKVVKFGGSSFIELSDYAVVAKYVTGMLDATDSRVVVVVSGMSGSTGRLLEAAQSIDPGLRPQVQDQVLSTAEMVSASFMRAALNAVGCPATDLWAHQAGIRSDTAATQARIMSIEPLPLLDALADHRVVVVAGGQAVDPDNRITMLGRNSSDLTAVALAATVSASQCDIYSDTRGIFTTDPHVVESARLLPQLTYQQCVAMSESGAKILHWSAVRYAQKHSVIIRCRQLSSALAEEATRGTSVGAGTGETTVVGDARARIYRLPLGHDSATAIRDLRETNLVAHAVDHEGTFMLAFPGGQDPGRGLADLGLDAEPVDGLGMVSVVEPDGTATRRLVGRADVDGTVASLHRRLYGDPVTEAGSPVQPKQRSRHSGLLLGGQ